MRSHAYFALLRGRRVLIQGARARSLRHRASETFLRSQRIVQPTDRMHCAPRSPPAFTTSATRVRSPTIPPLNHNPALLRARTPHHSSSALTLSLHLAPQHLPPRMPTVAMIPPSHHIPVQSPVRRNHRRRPDLVPLSLTAELAATERDAPSSRQTRQMLRRSCEAASAAPLGHLGVARWRGSFALDRLHDRCSEIDGSRTGYDTAMTRCPEDRVIETSRPSPRTMTGVFQQRRSGLTAPDQPEPLTPPQLSVVKGIVSRRHHRALPKNH